MKKIIKFKSLTWCFVLLTISLAFLSACSDDDLDAAGPPVVSQVRLVDPARKDSTFVQAEPGTLILVEGNNLQHILKVYFNEYEAKFNTVYNTARNLIITIPADAPTEATNAGVSNKLRIVTAGGETTYNFTLTPPVPTISSISNENALPGSAITINGANFYLVEKVIFPGNLEVTQFTAAANGRSIAVTVPAALAQSGILQVKTRYGLAKTVAPVNLTTGSTVVSNFDDINTLEWGCDLSSDAVKFPGARGKFAMMDFKGVTSGDGAWWNPGRSVNLLPAIQWVPKASLGDALDSYAVKFEIFVKDAWKSGSIFLVKDYDWTYLARYEPYKPGGVEFISAGWQTVTIPLSELRTKEGDQDGTGNSAASLQTLLGAEGKGGLNILFVNNSNGTSDQLISKMSIGIDNIRVVKIK